MHTKISDGMIYSIVVTSAFVCIILTLEPALHCSELTSRGQLQCILKTEAKFKTVNLTWGSLIKNKEFRLTPINL